MRNLKKSLAFGKKISFDTNTKIGPWFRFPIPKPGFGRTLIERESPVLSHQKSWQISVHLTSHDLVRLIIKEPHERSTNPYQPIPVLTPKSY